ncbi:MAG: TlpA family protein disulfide reductase [Planctomycetaceae bacterium]
MRFCATVIASVTLLLVSGCGGSDAPPADGTTETVQPPPTASIGTPKPDVSSQPATQTAAMNPANAGDGVMLDVSPDQSATEKDSPEWVLEEIALVRAAPISEDPSVVGQQRRERNARIIELATKLIAETHEDPKQEKFFNSAVRELLQTRLEMALGGQPDDIDALYADVRDLDERNHISAAAEEAAFTLVRFAHANAQRFAATEPQWFEELSRQSRLYADGYPKNGERAAPILFAAARSCEINAPKVKDPAMQKSLRNEAKLCYTALKDQFPGQPQGQRAVAILRRLRLVGQPLEQLSGPTLDGKFARIEQLRGRTKATVIVFWASDNEEFEQKSDLLVSTVRKHQGVYLLGVNMDEDELDVKAFLAKHPLPGKQIFFTDADKKRWDNPIVRYWGIVEVPTIWVLDKDGRVLSTEVTIDALDALLTRSL